MGNPLYTMKTSLIIIILFGWSTFLFAQPTTIFTEENFHFKQGLDLYNKGLYGLAKSEFALALEELKPLTDGSSQLIKTQTELYLARTLVRMDLPEGEKMILEFIRKNRPDPIADEANIEIANYYFDAKKYDKANEYYAWLRDGSLSGEQKSEVRFKQGYGYFTQKKFKEAQESFNAIKDNKNQYYYPANYYLGMCQFFRGNYGEAITSFNRVNTSEAYKSQIPYYISQIYFAQKKYKELVEYTGNFITQNPRGKNIDDIHLLRGQALFELKDYQAALLHLEHYESKNSRMRKEDFYQLGYTQYITGHHDRAIKSFSEISYDNSALGQNASFYSADSYLKTKNPSSARAAFAQAAKFDFDKSMKEDALFNYAKLSTELKYDREAIQALQEFKKDSKFHSEAQSLMVDIFSRTRDYSGSMRIIEDMDIRANRINEMYQKLAYLRGIQLINDNAPAAALEAFDKSLSQNLNPPISSLCHYWKADIYHQQGNFQLSISELALFLTAAKNRKDLPTESNYAMGLYLQGYNFFKEKKYDEALPSFREAGLALKNSSNKDIINKLQPDAQMRTGDCYFKQNKYKEAIAAYNEVINKKQSGYQYALFQKGIIFGLTGEVNEKIAAMRNIINDKSSSEYIDDALLELGTTYLDLNQPSQAKTPLTQLVNEYGTRSSLVIEALLKLGLVHYNQGEFTHALTYYKNVFKYNPEPKESQEALAAIEEIYIQDLGKPDEYFAFLETVPGYRFSDFSKDSLSFRSADILYESGNYVKAVEGYKQYLTKYPKGAFALVAHYRRGESFALLKQFNPALSDYEAVMERGNSEYFETALYKAAVISYNHSNNFEKALRYYSQVEKITTSSDKKLEAQIGSLQSAYRLNKSTEVYLSADLVTANNQATPPQKALAYYYSGKMAFDQKDYDRALQSFNQTIKLNDNVQAAEGRYLVAFIYYEKNEIDLAETLADKAVQDNSGHDYWIAKSLILASDIQVKKANYLRAEAALNAVIDNTDDPLLIKEAQEKLKKIKELKEQKTRIQPASNKLEFQNSNN